MNDLARCYKNGEGIEKNLEKSFYWLQKAAKNGNEGAMNNLAIYYENGKGTEKNLEKSFYWYQKAAENGNEVAMNYLAECYYNGKGTEKNLEKSFYLLQKAAENGNEVAMNNLAVYYNNVEGIEKNLEKSFYWLQKAAENRCEGAMNNLAKCYKYGLGTEKNLKKAFYWFQKAAENGDENTMNYLATCYYNGKETERNLDKAFYWYQKAAENGNEVAMYNLAICYTNDDGTERNLNKAFYWYQKAAEKGQINAQYNLALLYENGEGTEKNLEKAFYWYQKAIENGDEVAMHNLAACYYNGEGTEKNLEKAFYWFQKAAEKNNNGAMNDLARCYKNGEGTEKNLEKSFYWYQKVTENDKISELFYYDKCKECKQSYINYQWCQQCNSKKFQQDFLKWTSNNEFIDKFIQEAQLNAKNINEILEWIPYEKFKNINYYDKGGFSKIDKAIWLDGPIDSWNFDEQQWNRWSFQNGYEVILKNLNNSSNLNGVFSNEWKYHYNCQKKSFSKFVRFFGITQDPNSLNYIIVMSYVKEGSLEKCLPNIVKFNWHDKLQLLKKIILGLNAIHELGLIHCDLHNGNILISNNDAYIIDLGLCKPINNLQNSEDIYGVLPFMAPEVLKKKPYTTASDIYSLSMIMWEFTSGVLPFDNRARDQGLISSIWKGERPEIIENTPKSYIDLMKKCWDSDPTKRPTLKIIENTISEWLSCINGYEKIESTNILVLKVRDDRKVASINVIKEFTKVLVQRQANIPVRQSHPKAFDKSRSLSIEFGLNWHQSQAVTNPVDHDFKTSKLNQTELHQSSSLD